MSEQRRRLRPVWFPRLTRRGGMFLAVGGALFLNALVIDRRDLLFIACLLLAVPVVALVYVTVRPATVQLSRAIRPVIVPAGSDAVVALRVRNLSSRPVFGTRWRDTASPGITVPAGVIMPTLDRYEGGPDTGGDTARLEYTLTPLRRGVYDLGPLMLGRSDPFDLAVSERPVGEPHDLVVTPRITPLPGNALNIRSGDGSIHELIRHISPSSDELIAREYRPGDPLRRVNWPATARHGEIMVRQEEQRSNPAARIILDTTLAGRPAYAPTEAAARTSRHDQAFEVAVELTACVAVHLLDAGFRVELVELGPSQLAPAAGGGRGGLHGDAPGSFRAPGGDRLLLEGLASIVPAQRAAGNAAEGARSRRAAVSRGLGLLPTFAVLVDIDAQDAAELAAIRGRCAPAVAFVIDTMGRGALERLRDAGWRCIGLRTHRDIPAAWDQARQERGAVRDLA
ncbi:DUF58 domain-containing protein [Cryobacterium tagatosivorans]|uniref:DUF58 domain-containing protein n=1 Tax=Cryobacterium tagatosivorans TaxID=1259199 RepID=A0A4V3I6B3_9MICO|nr:DUF58 domain-containing protein [Cryobacterium tagatosivorans]TFB48178.1 DUF58 domain-containing protein [Cryobacterium tagatosivorans]